MTQSPPSSASLPLPPGPPPDHPQAMTVLVLGVVSVSIFPFLGPVAWIMGGRVRRDIDAAQGQFGGRELTTAGWVMGIVGTVFLLLFAAFIAIEVAIAVAITTS